MATGKALQNRVGALLKRLNATSRVVKLRNVTTSGGNTVLGIGGTVTTTDTVADPQPAVELLDADVISNSNGLYQVGDYRFFFSGAIPEATLRNRLIVYGDEILKVIRFDPVSLGGVVVVWEVTARTIKAGA